MAHALPAIGVTTQTYYRWCKGYGGTSVDQADRLRALEKDSQRLRQALSGLTFGKRECPSFCVSGERRHAKLEGATHD